ncbi:uncharacterized protein LOC122868941 [Siniperca chuatsi]|uniref:uncharacterized protein LOC122868941 n=1 Tax=Siniperca chuatsi TaxID=119488 RepID=UPI001CE22330|nr:uncharacterized protein LOC122868941 [Siniperca chuatsi]
MICVLVPLLLLLPPVCGAGLRTDNFKHYSDTKSWRDAQAYCREKHTDLITIRDANENQALFSGQGWIGLYREDSAEWKWSRRDEIANFTSWDIGEPDDGQNCAFKYTKKDKWDSDPCDVKHSFMCYNETLVLVKEKKTWEEALMHCRALEAVDPNKPATAYQNHRYDLATLLTPDDHDFAREKAQGATTDEVWTGLRHLAGHWVWVGGGGRVQYDNIKGCPTQRFCGVLLMTPATLFDIRDCSQRKNFLCYKKP